MIFTLSLYVDFFNRDGINRHDEMISDQLFWSCNSTDDSIIFPGGRIVNKATLTSFHKYCYFLKSKAIIFSNIRKRDVFLPEWSIYMEDIVLDVAGTECKTSWLHINVRSNLQKNYCSLLTSFIVLSHSTSHPWSHIKSSLRPSKTLST